MKKRYFASETDWEKVCNFLVLGPIFVIELLVYSSCCQLTDDCHCPVNSQVKILRRKNNVWLQCVHVLHAFICTVLKSVKNDVRYLFSSDGSYVPVSSTCTRGSITATDASNFPCAKFRRTGIASPPKQAGKDNNSCSGLSTGKPFPIRAGMTSSSMTASIIAHSSSRSKEHWRWCLATG